LNVYNKKKSQQNVQFEFKYSWLYFKSSKIYNKRLSRNRWKISRFFKTHREKLIEYEKDYHKSKTITEISIKLRIDIPTIIEYLQERLQTYLIVSQKESQKKMERY
jgi:hypothetical protein